MMLNQNPKHVLVIIFIQISMCRKNSASDASLWQTNKKQKERSLRCDSCSGW